MVTVPWGGWMDENTLMDEQNVEWIDGIRRQTDKFKNYYDQWQL